MEVVRLQSPLAGSAPTATVLTRVQSDGATLAAHAQDRNSQPLLRDCYGTGRHPAPCPVSSGKCKTILTLSDRICVLFADRNVPLIMRGCIATSTDHPLHQGHFDDIFWSVSPNTK